MSIKQIFYWFSLLLSSAVVIMNVVVLTQHDDLLLLSSPTLLSRQTMRQDFVQSLRKPDPSLATSEATFDKILPQPPIEQQQQRQQVPPQQQYIDPNAASTYKSHLMIGQTTNTASTARIRDYRRPRTLMGILSADTRNDCTYRKRHRELFHIWNDTRVCSLGELRRKPEALRKHCQLVYTFVIGAAEEREEDSKETPTLIVNSSIPLYRSSPLNSKFQDVNSDDVTLLNIKENMNDGKSPTFFYFASTILEEYNLDYAMKLDGDSILHLHDWFLFAHCHLPPRPIATSIAGGALRHKAFWPSRSHPIDNIRFESYWQEQYEGIHLYLAGQCYFLSLDLCHVVAQEAPLAGSRIAHGGYLEGHEDHDTTSMMFWSQNNNNNPVHLITIGKSQRFWEHPVKGQPRWERIRVREMARVQGKIFEDKQLRLYLEE